MEQGCFKNSKLPQPIAVIITTILAEIKTLLDNRQPAWPLRREQYIDIHMLFNIDVTCNIDGTE